MDNLKDQEEKQKKLLELKRAIEKKEKKLQKLYKVQRSKEHVKRTLEKVNKLVGHHKDTEHLDIIGNADVDSDSALSEVKTNPEIQPCPDRRLGESISGVLSNKAHPKTATCTSSPAINVEIDGSTLVEPLVNVRSSIADKKNPENDIHVSYDVDKTGDTEESPIVIADSQPAALVTSSLSSDESQNSKLGSRRRLSLKRKRHFTACCNFKKNRQTIGDCIEKEITSDISQDSESQSLLQEKLTDSIVGKNLRNVEFKEVFNQKESTFDSIEICHKRETKKKENTDMVPDGRTACASLSVCTENDVGESLATMKSNNVNSQKAFHEEAFVSSKTNNPAIHKQINDQSISTKEKTNNLVTDDVLVEETQHDLCGVLSQDIVIECTPDTTMTIDLNKAFVHDQGHLEMSEVDLQSTQKCDMDSVAGQSKLGISSQESIVESTQEDSQPKRRGRPSKIKRKSASLSKQVLQISPKTSDSILKVKNQPTLKDTGNNNETEKGTSVKALENTDISVSVQVVQTVDKQKFEEHGNAENNLNDSNVKGNTQKTFKGTFSQESIVSDTCISNSEELGRNKRRGRHSNQFETKITEAEKSSFSNTSGDVRRVVSVQKTEIIDKQKIVEEKKVTDKAVLETETGNLYKDSLSSQDSTLSSVSSLDAEGKPKRRRGRPPKKKVIKIKEAEKIKEQDKEKECNTKTAQKSNAISLENKTIDKKSVQQIEDITVPESQELFDEESHKQNTKSQQETKSQTIITSKERQAKRSLKCSTDTYEKESDSPIHESPELNTLKLIQESFVEKKEYSTRRRSSMGSPFMVSSLFQFLIDESKRSQDKDFDLPAKKFGKLMEKRQISSSNDEDSLASEKSISSNYTKTSAGCSDNKKIVKDGNLTENTNSNNDLCQGISSDFGLQTHDTKKTEINNLSNEAATFTEKEISKTENESMDDENSVGKNSEEEIIFKQEERCLNEKVITPEDSQESQTESIDSMSDQVITPEDSQESQTESIDSMSDQSRDEPQNGLSIKIPGNEKLVSLSASTFTHRRKEVPIIGCLCEKSLLIWKYHKQFTFLHQWDLPENCKAEKLSSFSIDGKAFFLILVANGDKCHDVYISFYCNKRDNSMFKVSSLETQYVDVCHVSNRVIAIGYSQGEIIHVNKFVLHNKWKSLATSEKLETTDGCLQSIHSVENLPAGVCVWNIQGELCLWNHENKRLLLKIHIDCLSTTATLVGIASEQGYLFLQYFYNKTDENAGVQVILNPTTRKSCVNSAYNLSQWKGLRMNSITDYHVLTLDEEDKLCIWDKFSTELLAVSSQDHVTCFTSSNKHILTGRTHCVHVH